MLHVHCGDCAARVAERAALPGRVFAWRDSSAVGPSSTDPDVHRALRARWWGVPVERMQSPRDLGGDGPIALWFGPDPWEQVALVEVLSGIAAADVSIVPLDRGAGAMEPDQLPARFEARRDAAGLGAMLRPLWDALCDDDRVGVRTHAARAGADARLPWMALAIERVLEDREAGRTERQVRSLLAEGVRGVPALMERLARVEHPAHGVWYGDVIVARVAAAAEQ